MLTKELLAEANSTLKTMPIKGKDYALVADRVKAFRAICPNGTIETEIVSMSGETVVIKATIKDGGTVLATGMGCEKESSSYINKTSYVENCETSAVGRALGFVGIGIDGSICSAEEVANAIKQQNDTKPKRETKPAQDTAQMPEQDATQKPASPMVKGVIEELCKKHKVPLRVWLTQENLDWDTLTAADAGKMLASLKQKFEDK